MPLFYVHDAADFHDNALRNQVASLVFTFILEIVKTLVDIINGDEKQNKPNQNTNIHLSCVV